MLSDIRVPVSRVPLRVTSCGVGWYDGKRMNMTCREILYRGGIVSGNCWIAEAMSVDFGGSGGGSTFMASVSSASLSKNVVDVGLSTTSNSSAGSPLTSL